MRVRALIEKLLAPEELLATLARFPLSIACALGLFLITVLSVHDIVDFDDEPVGRVCTVLGACYLWFGSARLAVESLKLRPLAHGALMLAGAGFFAVLALTEGGRWFLPFFYLFPALLLIVMFAPYLRGGDDWSVWFFNRNVWLGVFLSYMATGVFAGGVSGALWAVERLFGVDAPEEFYGDIWAFACLVLGPLYALSWVPKKFVFARDEVKPPPGLAFIANWITAPMVFVYLAILYAYFAKIVITATVPSGYLAYLIAGFAGAGIVTYLMAYPLRASGSPQLRLFYRVFFPALLIPAGFHFYAIAERVSAYGVTEQRYMLILSAVWFAVLALGFTTRRPPIRVVPMVLAGLMILASFGPWGAIAISGASQHARLGGLLARNGLLEDGHVVKARAELPFRERQNISSILEYMCLTNRSEMIEPWFGKDQNGQFECFASGLTARLGFEYVGSYQMPGEDGRFDLNAPFEARVDLRGYDFLIPNIYAYAGSDEKAKPWTYEVDAKAGGEKIVMSYAAPNLIVKVGSRTPLNVDLVSYVKTQLPGGGNDRRFVIEDEREGVAYRVLLSNVFGQTKDGAPQIESFHFDFFYKVKR